MTRRTQRPLKLWSKERADRYSSVTPHSPGTVLRLTEAYGETRTAQVASLAALLVQSGRPVDHLGDPGLHLWIEINSIGSQSRRA